MDAVEPLRLRPADGVEDSRPDMRSMWHITLTVAGPTVPEPAIKGALERLSEEHPFLLSGRYAADRAEVRYWEEATDVATALRMAVLLWDEHIASAQLPPWRVVGVEVVDRETFHRRGRYIHEQPGLVAAGRVIPF
jgi:hypothetical protein